MIQLGIHLALFFVISLVIVLLGCFYSEADDRLAWKSLPRRLLVFLFGCGALAAIMLVCEHTLASVD